MTTARSLHDEIRNVLDYLSDTGLALYTTDVSMRANEVSWHAHRPDEAFLVIRDHTTYEQYLRWVETGNYSAVLPDASLLQIAYKVDRGKVVRHRLAFVPCPCRADEPFRRRLASGDPIADVVKQYQHIGHAALRSPIRFDYDVVNAKPGHPTSHMTINSADCRIACVAPMHVLRFVDFVYRNFYPDEWSVHADYFAAAAWRHIDGFGIANHERTSLHMAWDIHARATPAPLPRRRGARSRRAR